MNITVFGASGGIGGHVIALAAQRGHHVRASDKVSVKAISRADVAWHILDLAESPDPGPQRTPVITTGGTRTARTAAPGTGRTSRQAPAAS